MNKKEKQELAEIKRNRGDVPNIVFSSRAEKPEFNQDRLEATLDFLINSSFDGQDQPLFCDFSEMRSIQAEKIIQTARNANNNKIDHDRKAMKRRQINCKKQIAWINRQEGQWLISNEDEKNIAAGIYMSLIPRGKVKINQMYHDLKHNIFAKRYDPLPTEKTLGFTAPTAASIEQTHQAMYLYRYLRSALSDIDEFDHVIASLDANIYKNDIHNYGRLSSQKNNPFLSITEYYSDRLVNSTCFGYVAPIIYATWKMSSIKQGLLFDEETGTAADDEQLYYARREAFFYYFKYDYDWNKHKDQWADTYNRFAKQFQNKNPLWLWLRDPWIADESDTMASQRALAQFLQEWGVSHNVNLRALSSEMADSYNQYDRRMTARGIQTFADGDEKMYPLFATINILMREVDRYRDLYIKNRKGFEQTQADKKKTLNEQKNRAPKYEKKIKNLQKENNRYQKNCKELSSENRKLEGQYHKLCDDIQTLKQENQALQQQLEDEHHPDDHTAAQEIDINAVMMDRLIPIMWPSDRTEGKQLKQLIMACAEPGVIKYQFDFSQKFIKEITKVQDFRFRCNILKRMIARLSMPEVQAAKSILKDETIYCANEKSVRQFRVSERPSSQRIMYQYTGKGQIRFTKYKIYSQHDDKFF